MSSNVTSTTKDTSYDVKALAFGDNNHLVPLIVIGGVAVGSIVVHSILTVIFTRVAKMSRFQFDNELVKLCYKPTLVLFPIGSILLTLQFVTNVHPSVLSPINHAFLLIFIGLITWTAICVVKAGSRALSRNPELEKVDSDMHARKLGTQLVVSTRILYGLIFMIGAAGIVFTFPDAREFGAALLASASVASLFLGLALKPTEIQAQYVVVKTGDERHLIIPLTRVIGGTFENLSRNGESVSTTFDLFVDYGVPLGDLRKQLQEYLQASEHWDQRNGSLDIFDAKENFLQLRAKVTAADIAHGNKLKGEIREKIASIYVWVLINYLVVNYPEYLPHQRLQNVPARNGGESMDRVIAKMSDPLLKTPKVE
ncbi:6699_t:CDS:2 [Ambispora gerdemannii]|uniref:6699_t:CDS:1 n=1 Tax=Ambispora gerdemannii TaxID=144530 RepID=A0A9N8WHL8_9GLOM|nr:6699_t:CDS:2 [Ambispora gerdemannii]